MLGLFTYFSKTYSIKLAYVDFYFYVFGAKAKLLRSIF